jgi:cell division protein FtsL
VRWKKYRAAGAVGFLLQMEISRERELEIKMTDWAAGIETRNYGIRSEIDGYMLSELMRSIVALAMVAGALLFFSWVRSQIVSIGYESQKLFAEEESLLRTQRKLILEEETLRNPERIDAIARNQLGLVPLRPNQLIQPQIRNAAIGAPEAMAMVLSGTAGLKRSAPAKASDTARDN